MSKQYNIRWKPDDNQELRKAVKNFNAKIDRIARKNPQIKNTLPEKVSVRKLKGSIDTRQDLKREINALKRFSKRGAEQLVPAPNNQNDSIKITKWQKEEMNRLKGYVNKRRARRLDEISGIEVTSGGKPQGYTRGQLGMGDVDTNALRPTNAFTPSQSKKDIDEKLKSLKKQARDFYYNEQDLQMKKNYIQGIIENYNTDDPRIAKVIEIIDDMDFKDFYKKVKAEDPTFEINSPVHGQDPTADYVEHLINTWNPEQLEN